MKLPSYLFGFTGHVGDYTVYRINGRTVVRSRHNSRPSAGSSPAQRLNRARWANGVNLWRRFPEGQRPAYDNRRPGQTDMNVFASMCLHTDPVYFTRRQGRDGACVAVPAYISQGALPIIGHTIDDSANIVSSIAVGDLARDPQPAVERLARAVVRENSDFRAGDIIRFYLAEQGWNAEHGIPTVRIRCDDLLLDLCDERPLPAAVAGSRGFALLDGHIAFEGALAGGVAWVHLRRSNAGWLHSTQRLICRNPCIAQYGSEAARLSAMESF